MSYFDPTLLASYETAPQFQSVDSYLRPATPMAVNCKIGHGSLTHPEADALVFYAMNHLSTVVRSTFTKHEPLPDWAQKVMQAHLAVVADQGCRIVKYLLLIITREARHIRNPSGSAFWVDFVEKFGQELMDYNFCLHGKGSDGAANYIMTNPPPGSIGRYVASVEHIHRHGSFSGGYGGKPWANIALQLLKFLKGELTLELLLDTAFTLAHNGGPIFNKGMFYHHYNAQELLKVLDVQRSGQCPELVLENPGQNPVLTGLVKLVKQHKPEAFGQFVDWQKVEDLGAIGSYTKLKAAQAKGKPIGTAEAFFEATKAVEPTEINGKPIVGKFAVTPKEVVHIVKRLKKAA